jgi:hypothetical protein
MVFLLVIGATGLVLLGAALGVVFLMIYFANGMNWRTATSPPHRGTAAESAGRDPRRSRPKLSPGALGSFGFATPTASRSPSSNGTTEEGSRHDAHHRRHIRRQRSVYGVRLLEVLRGVADIETHVVISARP